MKLNSEWGYGGPGLPGVYKGMYSPDELDYHPYFHEREGWYLAKPVQTGC